MGGGKPKRVKRGDYGIGTRRKVKGRKTKTTKKVKSPTSKTKKTGNPSTGKIAPVKTYNVRTNKSK